MAYDGSKPADNGKLIDAPSEIRANFQALKSDVDGKAAATHSHPQSESHGSPDTDTATTALHHTIGTGANQAAAGNHTHTQGESHGSADTDTATTAIHHTIGTGANQAAAGNHDHSGTYEPANANIQSHVSSTSNPHSVTKTQVGLENVPNVDCTNASNLASGTVPIERIPPAALERLIIVADETARFLLTTEQAQNGDTVKETSTGLMYFVIDDTQLDDPAGYSEYTAGQASACPWSGVTSKPTTISGFGITDAATAAEMKNLIITMSMGGMI